MGEKRRRKRFPAGKRNFRGPKPGIIMARLEEIKHGAAVKGILPDGFITVVDVTWIGSFVYRTHIQGQQRKAGKRTDLPGPVS